jgi:hypothetical protein
MDQTIRQKIIQLLDQHRLMMVATPVMSTIPPCGQRYRTGLCRYPAVAAGYRDAPGCRISRERRASGEPDWRCAAIRPGRLCCDQRSLWALGTAGSGVFDLRSGACDPGDPDHVVARHGEDADRGSDRQPSTSRRCRRVDHVRLPVRHWLKTTSPPDCAKGIASARCRCDNLGGLRWEYSD